MLWTWSRDHADIFKLDIVIVVWPSAVAWETAKCDVCILSIPSIYIKKQLNRWCHTFLQRACSQSSETLDEFCTNIVNIGPLSTLTAQAIATSTTARSNLWSVSMSPSDWTSGPVHTPLPSSGPLQYTLCVVKARMYRGLPKALACRTNKGQYLPKAFFTPWMRPTRSCSNLENRSWHTVRYLASTAQIICLGRPMLHEIFLLLDEWQ